jgi:hypothetical protein
MRFGRKQVLSLLLLVAVTSGCTSSHGDRPEPVQPTSAWKPADGPVHLDCDDGLTGPDLLTDETKLTDTVGSGLLESVSQLPHAGSVGILAPSEEWYSRKAPIFVASGSPTVILNVPEDGWQYLMWTSEEAWTSADGDHVNGASSYGHHGGLTGAVRSDRGKDEPDG